MTDWDDLSAPEAGVGITDTSCIWAIHLTTYPFQYAGRSKADRDAINLHDGSTIITGAERDHV